jgi:hypothetical protein
MRERDSEGQQHDERQDEKSSQGEKPSRGYRIPGRDFGGTSFAADQEEQTATHRGDTQRARMDDTGAGPHDGPPRDES